MNTKVCINCGASVRDKLGNSVHKLYDEALYKKTKIVKLISCLSCGSVVDRYAEYEGAIILLDLTLQNIQAYRHVLLNNNHQAAILKMAVITLIVEGYCRWAGFNTGERVEFFEQEYEFYIECGHAMTSLFVYLMVNFFVYSLSPRTRTCSGGGSQLILGLLLAYSTRFLQLVALLWTTPNTTEFLWFFIEGLFYLTSSRVLEVITGWGRGMSLVTMCVAHLAAFISGKFCIIL